MGTDLNSKSISFVDMVNRRKKALRLKSVVDTDTQDKITVPTRVQYSLPDTIFQIPPVTEICIIIMGYLDIDSLLVLVQLSKTWKDFCDRSFDCNRLWWKICMSCWYEDVGMQQVGFPLKVIQDCEFNNKMQSDILPHLILSTDKECRCEKKELEGGISQDHSQSSRDDQKEDSWVAE